MGKSGFTKKDSFWPRRDNCFWCDEAVSIYALCCPHCGHPGPGLAWKENLKKISFRIAPQKRNMLSWNPLLSLCVKWSDSNGKVFSDIYETNFGPEAYSKDYLAEIEVPANAHVSASMTIYIEGRGDDFGETLYLLPTDEQKTVISEPGIYEIVLDKVPKAIWFKTTFKDAFTINRIG
ncbi:MAG: hypothetical protein SPE18_10040 [Candidatus Limivicinus sp.]|nr:hypothetical protein [Candidatus Limivicinus sp.]